MAMVNIPVEAPMTEYLHAKASRLNIPLSGTFELTPVCNMACRMCYVRMTKAQQEALHPLRTTEAMAGAGKNRERQRNALSPSDGRGAFPAPGFPGDPVRPAPDGG